MFDFLVKMYQKQNSILNHKRVLKSMQTVQLSKLGQGSYILILHLKRTKIISIGKLGNLRFPQGYYTYVGSALGPGGLASRLKHHLHTTATPHWHIDYLRPRARLVEIWISEFEERLEHLWATMSTHLNETTRRFKGFGCSDCKCPSHLFYFQGQPSFQIFKKFVDSRSGKNGQLRRIVLT